MDYETIGEHQWEDTGIFPSLNIFRTNSPHEILVFERHQKLLRSASIVPNIMFLIFLSWADTERDLSAWLENGIQHSALEELGRLRKAFTV